MQKEVLQFWFMETEPKAWWTSDPAFDDRVRKRFAGLLQQAAMGELFEWRNSARGRLAEIIVLDQFSRNIWRNTPRAFSQDAMALALSQEAVSAGIPKELSPVEQAFLLMPYMHSESARIHVVAETLFKQYSTRENYDFELRHKTIIDRFGRYPHRNAILGRVSTAEEVVFLKQPGSSF